MATNPQEAQVALIVGAGDATGGAIAKRYALEEQGGILNPQHIAENHWHLHAQPRDAWTFELDLRPYMERW